MTAVRWAVLGTAQIAAGEFLPSLLADGGGRAEVVASRDERRAAEFAARHGVARHAGGYQQAVEDPGVDAVYVALPNALHAEWTTAALRAGKAVLCEKPFATDLPQARAVAAEAQRSAAPAWEAFAFLFHPQTRRVLELVRTGAIGAVREVHGAYHSELDTTGTIRGDAALGGGALFDLGVYPLRLTRLLLGDEFTVVGADQRLAPSGVDLATSAVVDFASGARLHFETSYTQEYAPAARIVGDLGELRIAAPYATGPEDTLELDLVGEGTRVEHWGSDRPLFTDQVAHIHAALSGTVAARHRLGEDAAGTLALVDAIRAAAPETKGHP